MKRGRRVVVAVRVTAPPPPPAHFFDARLGCVRVPFAGSFCSLFAFAAVPPFCCFDFFALALASLLTSPFACVLACLFDADEGFSADEDEGFAPDFDAGFAPDFGFSLSLASPLPSVWFTGSPSRSRFSRFCVCAAPPAAFLPSACGLGSGVPFLGLLSLSGVSSYPPPASSYCFASFAAFHAAHPPPVSSWIWFLIFSRSSAAVRARDVWMRGSGRQSA